MTAPESAIIVPKTDVWTSVVVVINTPKHTTANDRMVSNECVFL